MSFSVKVVLPVVLGLGLAQAALAASGPEESAGSSAPVAPADSGTQQAAGFEKFTSIAGPNSASAQLKVDHTRKKTLWRFKGLTRFAQPYYDFQARVKKDYGLAFGADYQALYQNASKSMGEDDAAGGIFRLYGTWALVGRESGNTGSLVAKFENRSRLGGGIPPQALGSEIGYVGLTAIVYSDAGNELTNLYWDQRLYQGRLTFIAGIIDPTDYLNVYGLVNPWTDFTNLSFSTDPTIPVPNQGLGTAVQFSITEHYRVIVALNDANADPTEPFEDVDTFFSDGDYFKSIEFGWIGSAQTAFTDNINVSAWQVDARPDVMIPKGWGAALSFSRKVTENWMPFARAGYSDGGGGTFLERSLSAGVGYFPTGRSDVLGLGAAWGRPSEKTYGAGLDDQYTLEAFYRLQLFQHTSVYGDIQLLIDPALNPEASSVWVFGLSAKVAF